MSTGKRRAEELFRRGVESFRAAKLAEAKKYFEDAIGADASFAAAHHGLGLVALEHGDAAAAVPHLQRASEVDPRNAAHLLNLGATLRKLQRYTEALAACDRVLEIDPRSATAHNNRGNVLRDLDRYPEALAAYDQAIALQPGYVETHHNRGVLLQKIGRPEEALESLDQAIRLRPEYVDAHNTRGNVLRELGRWDDARLAYGIGIDAAAGITGNPPNALADAHYNRSAVLRDQGDSRAAMADLRAALALRPDFRQARWALAFAGLTPVHDSIEDMAAARDRFAIELTSLSADCHANPGALADWEPGVGAAQPFYLSYHGFNERDLLSTYGALACEVMEDWKRHQAGTSRPAEATHRMWEMPREDRMSEAAGPTEIVLPRGRSHSSQSEGSAGDRIRVGFISAQVHRHSVWDVLTRGWLTRLDRKRFDVTCYYVGWRRDRETALARKAAGNFVMGPRPLSAWVEQINRDRPDVIIYPEIGMDPTTVKLAAMRLAPVQCVAWGHPTTSGLPTLDYFLGAELLEPPGAEAHYSETLVRLPNLGCYFEPLNAEASRLAEATHRMWEMPREDRTSGAAGPTTLVRREDADVPRFICCQQVAKYHPEFDGVFVGIAKELGRCRFTFVELARTHGAWERFRQRLGRVFAGAGLNIDDYCDFLPTLPRREFLALLNQQDVYLDTLSFSGFTTAIQALNCGGLPVVTLEGDLMRKRLAAGILRRIGVTDSIAGNVDDYVRLAVQLGHDPQRRAELRARITKILERAYRDETVIRALEAFLYTAG